MISASSPRARRTVVAHLRRMASRSKARSPSKAPAALRSVYCRDPDSSLIEISSYGVVPPKHIPTSS